MSEQNYGLAWSEKFELGCPQVDAQHKRLFELVRELVKACTLRYDIDVLNETLDFLVEYTVQHFNDEEELQKQYNYPEYEYHKQLHEDFKLLIGEKVQHFRENGSSEELSNDVNRIVVRWLISHIQREDSKIGEFIRSREGQTD